MFSSLPLSVRSTSTSAAAPQQPLYVLMYARGGSILDWFSKVGDCRCRHRRMLAFLWPRAVNDTPAREEKKKFAILVKVRAGKRAGEKGWKDRWIGELFVRYSVVGPPPTRMPSSTSASSAPLRSREEIGLLSANLLSSMRKRETASGLRVK